MADEAIIAILAGGAYPAGAQLTAVFGLLVVTERWEVDLTACAYIVLVAKTDLVDIGRWLDGKDTTVQAWYLTV